MKYSIILPVRNGGAYIKECVKSILSQTLEDFNLIILDNCSTDDTKEWLVSLNDKRITVMFSEKPLSIEESWARILKVEKNEFITIIGHDDILYPNFLEIIDELIGKNPLASLYLTHFNLIDSQGKLLRPCKPMSVSYTADELLKAILTNAIDIMGTGYVMRARDYDQLKGIPIKYPSLLYADFELWVNLANISFEVVSPVNCFAFRMHQSTSHSSQDQRLHMAMDLLIDYLSSLKQSNAKMNKVINDYAGGFLLFYCRGFSHRLLRTDIKLRNGMSVEKMIEQTRIWAERIELNKQYHPEKMFSIRFAKIIDNNFILRKMFLLLKRVYPKSIIKK